MATNNWTPSSWRDKPIAQDVTYEDKEELDRVLGKLRRLPPLVSTVEVRMTTWVVADGRSTSCRSSSLMSPPARRSSCKAVTAPSSLMTALR